MTSGLSVFVILLGFLQMLLWLPPNVFRMGMRDASRNEAISICPFPQAPPSALLLYLISWNFLRSALKERS